MSLPDNVVIDYATDAGLRDALFTVILVLAHTQGLTRVVRALLWYRRVW